MKKAYKLLFLGRNRLQPTNFHMQALVQLEIKGQSMQNTRFYLLLSFFTREKGQNFVSDNPLTDREDGKNDGYYHVSRITDYL